MPSGARLIPHHRCNLRIEFCNGDDMRSILRMKERTTSEQVLALNGQMEQAAAAGDWPEIVNMIEKRDAMLREIADSEQHTAFMAACRSTDQIRLLAESARRDVADKLTTLQRGKEAADSYQANASG